VSDFDRTHRLVFSYLWDLPQPAFARPGVLRLLFSDWQVAGIVVAMSGLPIDIVDSGAGSFYGFDNGQFILTRPNYAPGALRRTATNNVPAGYFFNPSAFASAVVLPDRPIPSSNGLAVAGELGTDIGSVGRNVLRGPRQGSVDFSIGKRFRLTETQNFEFRAEFFNLFNQVNLNNPLSDFAAVERIDRVTGQVIAPGDFGRILSTNGNPRLIQFALKFNF
jgi:hypothetical protein